MRVNRSDCSRSRLTANFQQLNDSTTLINLGSNFDESWSANSFFSFDGVWELLVRAGLYMNKRYTITSCVLCVRMFYFKIFWILVGSLFNTMFTNVYLLSEVNKSLSMVISYPPCTFQRHCKMAWQKRASREVMENKHQFEFMAV